jgi:glycogen synthase
VWALRSESRGDIARSRASAVPPHERQFSVLLLGPYPPPWGGVQTNLVALRDFLIRRGVECSVINLTRYQRNDRDGVYYPRRGVDVLRLLFRLRCDVVHLHIGGDLSRRLQWLGLVCSALPWARVVLTFHSGGYPRSPAGQSAGPRTFRGFVLRRIHRHIAVNEELLDFLLRVGCDPGRVRLIPPHAVPASTLADLGSSELPAEVAAFAATHAPLIVSVSGLEPEYDVPLQVAALARVRERCHGAGLLVIGSGSMLEQLRASVNARHYREHVLLAGDLPHATTLSAVARGDLFLRTTQYDGDAISVREALWLGTPVIATDNAMRPPGVHLVPVGDEAALTEAILTQVVAPRAVQATDNGAPSDRAGEENLEATLRLYRELLH